jgi:hypothetical protein
MSVSLYLLDQESLRYCNGRILRAYWDCLGIMKMMLIQTKIPDQTAGCFRSRHDPVYRRMVWGVEENPATRMGSPELVIVISLEPRWGCRSASTRGRWLNCCARSSTVSARARKRAEAGPGVVPGHCHQAVVISAESWAIPLDRKGDNMRGGRVRRQCVYISWRWPKIRCSAKTVQAMRDEAV